MFFSALFDRFHLTPTQFYFILCIWIVLTGANASVNIYGVYTIVRGLEGEQINRANELLNGLLIVSSLNGLIHWLCIFSVLASVVSLNASIGKATRILLLLGLISALLFTIVASIVWDFGGQVLFITILALLQLLVFGKLEKYMQYRVSRIHKRNRSAS